VYACAASILPVLIFPILAISAPTKPPPDFVLLLSFLSMLMVFPLVGALMFGGIGFFENKYQLWVIQDAPDEMLRMELNYSQQVALLLMLYLRLF
jgi:hypothetical protein